MSPDEGSAPLERVDGSRRHSLAPHGSLFRIAAETYISYRALCGRVNMKPQTYQSGVKGVIIFEKGIGKGFVVNEKDYYRVLGVEKSTGQQQIKEAYRRLAFQYHPDRNKGDADSVEKMKEINEAYAVLSDPEKRSRYDGLRQQYGSYAYDRFRQNYSEQDIYRNSDINQIFEEMARAFGFRSFDEVFRGPYGARPRTAEFRGPGMFGKVIIFGAGNRRRDRAVVQGSEKPGIAARAANRLMQYVLRKMARSIGGGAGKDVYETITLDEREAARGGKVVYLDQGRSKELSIAIPPGIREGQMIRLKGMGGGSPGKGDLYLKVEIRRPLLKKVREFLGV